MTLTPSRARQTAVVHDWHPTMSSNGSVGHWATRQKKHDLDQTMAWAAAKQAGWEFVPGRVKLTITLVYPRRYRVDADNLVAKCKGLIDGLKKHETYKPNRRIQMTTRAGFFQDDSTDHLDLEVRAEVVTGVRETRMCLEPVA